MQKAGSVVFVIMLLIALTLGPAPRPVAAQAAQPPAPTPTPGATEYLLGLALPGLSQMGLHAPLSPAQVQGDLSRIVREAARPVLFQLKRFQESGIVGKIELRPELGAIAVEVLQPDQARKVLSTVRGIASFTPSAAVNSCAQQRAQALPKVLSGLQSATRQGAFVTAMSTAYPTDPHIEVYAQGEGEIGWVTGYTTPNTKVDLSFQRGGKEIHHASLTSNADGSFGMDDYFFDFCDFWMPAAGDVISVTAHGNTVSTSVTFITATVDPDTDEVTGKTAPNQTVRVDLATDQSSATPAHVAKTLTAGNDGAFSWDFTGSKDFRRDTLATISAVDANGNTTFATFQAFQLTTDLGDDYVYATLRPNRDLTASLQHGSQTYTLDQYTEYSTGYYQVYLHDQDGNNYTPTSGDTITVSDGLSTLNYTFVPFSVALNPADHTATGTSATSHVVKASYWLNGNNTCARNRTSYSSAPTNASGQFTLPTPNPFLHGDSADFEIYDSEGNVQESNGYSIPSIVVSLETAYVSGVWSAPDLPLTITRTRGVTSETINDGNYDGSYFVEFSSLNLPGDVIQVTDGSKTESMTIPAVTGVLNNDTDTLSGNDPANQKVIANFFHMNRGYLFASASDVHCLETTAAGSAYSFDLKSYGVIGNDQAVVIFTGTDGNFTTIDPSALTIIGTIGSPGVNGYALGPGAQVTGQLWNGPSLLKTVTATSSSYSFYSLDFAQALSPGQRVIVTTGGLTASLDIPTLSAVMDPAGNKITGSSPANEPITVVLILPGHWYDSMYFEVKTADGAGQYSASFNTISYSTECVNTVPVGSPCASAMVVYTQADGQIVMYEGARPADVAPDSYEQDGGDNTFLTAAAYTGRSSHTFDRTDDVDWVKITIAPEQVGLRIRLMTVNLGPGAATHIDLYDSNGDVNSPLAFSNDYTLGNGASLLDFVPAAAGDYYVKISPDDATYNTVRCGTGYDFVYYDHFTYFPVIGR